MTNENKTENKKAEMFKEDRDVIKNHLTQSAKRVMTARFEGSAQMAIDLLAMAARLDTVTVEPRPEPKKRK